jgi:hypothetical protein
MAHVLFITEKYHTDSTIGLTNNMWNLIGSYECSGLGTYTHKFIDPENIWSGEGVDHELLTNQYDAAIISVYHHLPSFHVAAQFGHKTCFLWWDSCLSMDGVRHHANVAHQLCFDWGKGEEYPNCFCVEVPQDTRIFYPDDNLEKDIDVSFVGSLTDYWSDRIRLIKKIEEAGIKIWYGGGRGHGLGNLPIEEYAAIHRRSKICLNLSYGHGRPQRKGRSFELAASKSFMMSNCPEMMDGWFGRDTEYVPFDDENIVDKINYYLDHEEERKHISHCLYETYRNNYSPVHFWTKILKICGVNS